ncbi:hypothetical protein [Streptomyces mirabilis]|uniref:hypothetical protein n=1 Tax=Streptomyces mirabilis TaxID=68239 RepID=UPI0038075C9B
MREELSPLCVAPAATPTCTRVSGPTRTSSERTPSGQPPRARLAYEHEFAGRQRD